MLNGMVLPQRHFDLCLENFGGLGKKGIVLKTTQFFRNISEVLRL
jgi:hypothetical protein